MSRRSPCPRYGTQQRTEAPPLRHKTPPEQLERTRHSTRPPVGESKNRDSFPANVAMYFFFAGVNRGSNNVAIESSTTRPSRPHPVRGLFAMAHELIHQFAEAHELQWVSGNFWDGVCSTRCSVFKFWRRRSRSRVARKLPCPEIPRVRASRRRRTSRHRRLRGPRAQRPPMLRPPTPSRPRARREPSTSEPVGRTIRLTTAGR